MLRRWSRYFPKQLILLGAPLIVAISLIVNDGVWEWDNVIYDLNIKSWQRPAPGDVVIIAIDQASLNELGPWPWSRDIHAQLIDKLSAIGVAAIGLDIVFAEPNVTRPQADAELVRAVAANGRVILPVFPEQLRAEGQMIEMLAFPALSGVAAAFGHVDIELDRDGIARRTFLQAGLGEAYWPTFAEQILQLRYPDQKLFSGNSPQKPAATSSLMNWVRSEEIMIPFFGPPGHFARTSYIDVLDEKIDPLELQNKIILVGFTTSTNDVLPTPVSAAHQPMPGVEIHANIFETLRQRIILKTLPMHWRILLSTLMLLMPLALLLRLAPRWSLLVTLGGVLIPLLGSVLLLRVFHIWFPPVVVIASVLLAYLIWSWQRLQTTVQYLNQELKSLHSEPTLQSVIEIPQFETVMRFLRHVLSAQGFVLYNPKGVIEQQWGTIPEPLQNPSKLRVWSGYDNNDYWINIPAANQGNWRLGVRWGTESNPGDKELLLLDRLVIPYTSAPAARPRTPVELIETRIEQIQRATKRLRAMRAFINNSLKQMPGGVIVADNIGRVILANPHAALYLQGNANQSLTNQTLAELLNQLEYPTTTGWQPHLRTVLLERKSVQQTVRNQHGQDFLMEMAPFSDDHFISGVILNFTDISELKESERRRREMLGFLSHDLRSPVASVMALAQLAEYKPEKLASGEIIEQIQQRAGSLLEMVDEYLQLVRAESGEDIALMEIDITQPAESAVLQVEPQAATRQAVVSTRFQVEHSWLLGNENLLERMFVNLLTNAIKYSPIGSSIELGIEDHQEEIHCWVKDNGYGIAAEAIPTLFNRFKRVQRQEHSSESGVGLGLAFVKTVLDRHNARIEVVSELNKGSCFHLYFPTLDEQ